MGDSGDRVQRGAGHVPPVPPYPPSLFCYEKMTGPQVSDSKVLTAPHTVIQSRRVSSSPRCSIHPWLLGVDVLQPSLCVTATLIDFEAAAAECFWDFLLLVCTCRCGHRRAGVASVAVAQSAADGLSSLLDVWDSAVTVGSCSSDQWLCLHAWNNMTAGHAPVQTVYSLQLLALWRSQNVCRKQLFLPLPRREKLRQGDPITPCQSVRGHDIA